MDIIFKGSPNFSSRNKPIKKIVIHWFGVGTLESANARFQNPAQKSSAHYGISKGRIWQWVKEENTAWHAGNLSVNQESIGIEHDAVLNDHDLSEEDYKLSGKLVAEICKRYNIPIDRQHIVGHKEIKPTQCPGTIDINKIIYNSLLQENNKMEFFQVTGELTLVVKNLDGKYYEFATTPELWPYVAKTFGLEGKSFNPVNRDEVTANYGGKAQAGITFVTQ